MNSETILRSHVLDILFEGRNKAYGAYNLRKYYSNRLIKSLGLMMLSVLALSVLTRLPVQKSVTIEAIDTALADLIEPAPPKKAETPLKKGNASTPKKHGLLPVITDKSVKDTIEDILPGDNREVAVQAGTGDAGMTIAEGPETAGAPEGATLSVPVPKETPLSNPDVMPEYPGGLKALRKFLERNLQNPRDMETGEKISVKINFVVGLDGKLKSFGVLEDGGREFNEEVLRVLKKMPAWIPGRSKGQNVSVYYTIPVKFLPQE